MVAPGPRRAPSVYWPVLVKGKPPKITNMFWPPPPPPPTNIVHSMNKQSPTMSTPPFRTDEPALHRMREEPSSRWTGGPHPLSTLHCVLYPPPSSAASRSSKCARPLSHSRQDNFQNTAGWHTVSIPDRSSARDARRSICMFGGLMRRCI